MVRVRAPQFPANLPWLNCAAPLSLKALQGRIVLLDFWTYGCINCLHVLPDLKYLEQTYKQHLTIIGVHTAKFEGEQHLDSIQQAIWRHEIAHPVLVDRDREVWDRYTIRAWPSFVLIDPQGYVVATLAGEGQQETLEQAIRQLLSVQQGQDPPPNRQPIEIPMPQPWHFSPLAFPGKVLADEASNSLWIADSGHHRLIETTLDGHLKAIIGTGIAGWQDGDWETAQFSHPQGLAYDRDRQALYVADTGNHLLRRIELTQGQVTTLAGTGVQSSLIFPHGGSALETALNSPWDLVQLGNTIYIAMAGSHQIWQMDLEAGTIQCWMGTGAEFCVDGPPDRAAFAQPSGVTTDGHQLWIADSETSSIRSIHLGEPPVARTLCGSGQLFEFGDQDGVGSAARLQHCLGITFADGVLWVADTYNHRIKRVFPLTGSCESACGTGEVGWRDGVGGEACFSEPSGLTATQHQLYVADTNNHAIRCIDRTTLAVTTLLIPNLCPPTLCLPTSLAPSAFPASDSAETMMLNQEAKNDITSA